jgi:aquaporin related protein
MIGEYVGTVLFLYFALSGCQVANSIKSSAGLTIAETGANPQQLQYIALCFGFSLAVNAWVFFRISGGLFNPAVTVGMCLIGALPWVRGCLLFVVQLLGGITASALVACMFPGDLDVQTSLGGGTSITQGLFIEMMLTAQLIFTIFMLAAEKHKGTFIAPVGIGLSLFVAELTGISYTSDVDLSSNSSYRSLLHWWLSEPSSVLWASARKSPFSWLSLDILGRTHVGCHPCLRILQVYQSS